MGELSEEQLRVLEVLREILSVNRDLTEEEQAQVDLLREETAELELDAKIRMDEYDIKKKLWEVDFKRKGIFGGIMDIAKNHMDLIKEIGKHTELLKIKEAEIEKIKERINAVTDPPAVKAELQKTVKKLETEGLIEKKVIASKSAMMGMSSETAAMAGNLMKGASAGMMVGQVFFKIAGLLWSGVVTVVKFIWGQFKEVWKVLMDIQTVIGNFAADVGLSVVQTNQLYGNIRQIGVAALKFGVTFKEAVGFMRDFSEITGINRVFLADQVQELSAVAKATGLGADETGKMYAKMELVGVSTTRFHQYVEGVRKSSGELNLNVTKVLKTVNDLLPAFLGLNFKDGIQGLTSIVQKAQGLRFELSNMRNLANKVFNPEGAVELAAKLKVLGGGFAAMADPFNLMLKGQTDAAGLMDDVMKTFSGLATKGKDGLFSIPPVQQALIREFAEATGENADNIIKGAMQMAKQSDIMGKMGSKPFINEADKKLIANLAEMEGGQYKVKVDASGIKVAVQDLTATQIKSITEYRAQEEQVARARMNINEQFQNIYQRFLISLAPAFQKVSDALSKSGFMDKLASLSDTWGEKLGVLLEGVFTSGNLEKVLTGVMDFIEKLLELFTGEGTFISKVSKAISDILTVVLQVILPAIGDMLEKSGLGKIVKGLGGIFGGLGGAGGGAIVGGAIGSVIAPGVGTAIGIALGSALGGGGGYLAGKSIVGSMLPKGKADDFVMRGDGKAQQFNKGDLIIGGTQLTPRSADKATPMVSSRNVMQQVKTYEKSQFTSLNTAGGGGRATPENIALNMTGTLEIRGESESAYLTSADLKNVGIQYLTHQVLIETDRYRNQMSSKKLSSEIISPIKS